MSKTANKISCYSNLINPSLEGRYCLGCQLDFLILVNLNARSQQSVIIVILDMLKAFDRVSHSRMPAKMRSYRTRNSILSWVSSYISDRFQAVTINGNFSQPYAIACYTLISIMLFVMAHFSFLPVALKYSTSLRLVHLAPLLQLSMKV